LAINADVTILSEQGDISLTAGQSITQATGGLIQTGGDALISIQADIGDATAGAGAFTQAGDAEVRHTGTGSIDIDADGNIALTNVLGGDETVVNIATTTTTITDVDNSTGLDISGGAVTLSAINGIGVAAGGVNGALEIDASSINATNTATVGVFLNSLGSRDLAATIAANGTGDVTLLADADVHLVSVTTAGAAGDDGTITTAFGDIEVDTVSTGGAGNLTITSTSGFDP